MAQILSNQTFATGGQVTAEALNNHVNQAVLLPGAVTGQESATSVTGSDKVLISQNNVLKQCTVSQITGTNDTSSFIKRDGSVSMTGELVLSSSSPSGTTSAASKGYVDGRISALGGLPVGAITAYAGTTVPTGWLECDGSTIPSDAKYDALRTLLVNTKVPDLRSYFIRGASTVTQIRTTAEASVGSFSATLGGVLTCWDTSVKVVSGETDYPIGVKKNTGNIAVATTGTYLFTTGATETAPKHMYLMYIIKY